MPIKRPADRLRIADFGFKNILISKRSVIYRIKKVEMDVKCLN